MLNCYYMNIHALDDESFFANSLKKVDEKRREKVLAYKNEADRKRSLLAGLLLRYGLEAVEYNYEELLFSTSPDGKPILLDTPVHFNISHAGGYVACVLSDEPVGLDIEFSGKTIFLPEKKHALEAMAKKCLSPDEKKVFDTSLEKETLFLEYWTKKEAYSKFVGKGLGMDFSDVDTEGDKRFWNTWIADGYHMSIYRMSEKYEELMIERVSSEKL